MTIFANRFAAAAIAAGAIVATLALSAAPAEARNGRNAAFFGGLAAGVVGAAIVGNAYASPVYGRGHYHGYGACWREKRPIYNRWGDFRGYRYIRVCR